MPCHSGWAKRPEWDLHEEQGGLSALAYAAPYRTYALQSDEFACDLALDGQVFTAAAPYPAAAKPVFFGHYWLLAERPGLLAGNVACLDYSVAKGGLLCAYRWNGEKQLSTDNFVWHGGETTPR